jgi:hypothetical protein
MHMARQGLLLKPFKDAALLGSIRAAGIDYGLSRRA